MFPLTPRSEGAERMPESEDGKERGIRIKGWEVRSKKSGIATAEAIESTEQHLGTKHLPELLFSDSILDLLHVQSGIRIAFTPLEALREWCRLSLPPIQVAVSRDWKKSREQEVHELGVKVLDYDWTFTTPYEGHTESTKGMQFAWQDTNQSINREILMRREPILFYDELSLFESELDDHGACKLIIKLRVMPSCWYVLMRYWLRVDEVLVRLKDTRLFCQFQEGEPSPKVIREVKHCEGTFEQLKACGAPTSFMAHYDPDSTAACFESIAPTGMTLLKVQELRM